MTGATDTSTLLRVLGAPASVPSVLILFPLLGQKAEIVEQPGDGLCVAQHIVPDHALKLGGLESFCRDPFVFFRLRLAGGQLLRQQYVHALFEKSGSGEDVQELAETLPALPR